MVIPVNGRAALPTLVMRQDALLRRGAACRLGKNCEFGAEISCLCSIYWPETLDFNVQWLVLFISLIRTVPNDLRASYIYDGMSGGLDRASSEIGALC